MRGRSHQQQHAASKLDQEERASGGDSDRSRRMVEGPVGGGVFLGGSGIWEGRAGTSPRFLL